MTKATAGLPALPFSYRWRVRYTEHSGYRDYSHSSGYFLEITRFGLCRYWGALVTADRLKSFNGVVGLMDDPYMSVSNPHEVTRAVVEATADALLKEMTADVAKRKRHKKISGYYPPKSLEDLK